MLVILLKVKRHIQEDDVLTLKGHNHFNDHEKFGGKQQLQQL